MILRSNITTASALAIAVLAKLGGEPSRKVAQRQQPLRPSVRQRVLQNVVTKVITEPAARKEGLRGATFALIITSGNTRSTLPTPTKRRPLSGVKMRVAKLTTARCRKTAIFRCVRRRYAPWATPLNRRLATAFVGVCGRFCSASVVVEQRASDKPCPRTAYVGKEGKHSFARKRLAVTATQPKPAVTAGEGRKQRA